MSVLTRPMQHRDHAAVAGLMVEMQAHYRVPCPPLAQIRAALADLPPGNDLMLAEAGGAIAGFAAHALQWPGPGLRRGLYLKELYVAAAHRGRGIGAALMSALARRALDLDCARIDLTAAADDPGLLQFYAATGARHQDRKAFHRIDGPALVRLAGRG